MSIFSGIVGCDIQLVSYGLKHTLQSHSDMTFSALIWKLQVVHGRSTYQMTALLLKMSNFWVTVAHELWLASYGFKHTLQSLCDKPFVPENYWLYMDVLHIEWLFYYQKTLLVWFRFAIEIPLESYGPRHVLVILWYNIVCAYCKPIHTMHHWHLYCQWCIVFVRTKWASYTTRCSVFLSLPCFCTF